MYQAAALVFHSLKVGELFNLPLVSECVDWARYVVRRHFALVGGAMGAM